MTRRAFAACAVSIFGPLAGCGTILHPERRGQPAGALDWSVVALDAIGLVFFFVPGVIAFAVDFATGAIYVPAYSYGADDKTDVREQLVSVSVPAEELSTTRIEEVVSQTSNTSVRLSPGGYRTRPLKQVADFWDARNELVQVD